MHKLTITSWHAQRPNETAETTVQLSAEEYYLAQRCGARGLRTETLSKLPPCESWFSFNMSDEPFAITPTPRDMRNGVWRARQLAHCAGMNLATYAGARR